MENEQGSTGTARLLHEMSEYEMLEFDYGQDIALAVTTKAFQRHDPNINQRDVEGLVKCARATMAGGVDIAAQRQELEDKAQKAAQQLLEGVTTPHA